MKLVNKISKKKPMLCKYSLSILEESMNIIPLFCKIDTFVTNSINIDHIPMELSSNGTGLWVYFHYAAQLHLLNAPKLGW